MKPTICQCCGNNPLPGQTCEQCGLTGERVIAKRDILRHLQQHIVTLKRSHFVTLEPLIRLEIRCFEAAAKIVMESEGL